MPAHKSRLSKYKRKKKKINILTPLILVIFIFSIFVYLYRSSEFWDRKNKLSIVINKKNLVQISTFDPEVSEIVNVVIPGNTEVEVSRQLGRIKVRNVWQLGVNEGFEGKLLAETITHHFKFPVPAWADSDASGFSDTNLASLFKATFLPYKTNLKIGDRIRIAAFALRVKNIKRVEINLSETSYIRRIVLADGSMGYVVDGSFPQNLLVVFSDNEIARRGTTAVIIDKTSDANTAEELGEVIEVLGAKVASIEKREEESFDCEVEGKNTEIAKRVAVLFSCDVIRKEAEGNFDLLIKIGDKFADRF